MQESGQADDRPKARDLNEPIRYVMSLVLRVSGREAIDGAAATGDRAGRAAALQPAGPGGSPGTNGPDPGTVAAVRRTMHPVPETRFAATHPSRSPVQ